MDSPRLRVDPAVFGRFPGYAAVILYADGLTNGPSDDTTASLLRAAEGEQRAAFGDRAASGQSHVAAWRAAFSAFGSKPSSYPCSAEALLKRVLRGEELPAINRLVDAYNAVSVRCMLPVGGEDLDRVEGELWLRFATGEEPFDELIGGEEVISRADPGEVVWADSAGVTCRRWNWRQCRRTRLMEKTRRAYFVLDRLEPYPLDALLGAADELTGHLERLSPGCRVERELLARHSSLT